MKAGLRKTPRIDIASIRREQIVEAAVAVIAEQGLQRLSLSEIENKIGMSRGQLTYYFKTKEAILLAVFDRLVEMICQQCGDAEGSVWQPGCWQDVVRWVLGTIMERPPAHPEFGCLQYTFLSQIGHREDYRRRLATLYADWRGQMAQLLEAPRRASGRRFSLESLASLIQAIFHGLAMQCAADPNAFRADEMIPLCLDILETYLKDRGPPRRTRDQQTARARKPARCQTRANSNGVHS
jgi:AcrR family transcriptional regulator